MSVLDQYRSYLAEPPAELRATTSDSTLVNFGPAISALLLPDGFLPSLFVVGDTVEQLYEACTWSYAAISANAEAVSSLPLKIQIREDGHWRDAPDHELTAFIEEPLGPGQRPTWNLNQYLEVMALQLQLVGDSFARIATYRRGRIPQLDPWHPQDVRVIDDGRRAIAYQHQPAARGEFTRGGQDRTIVEWAPRDVMQISVAAPSSMVRGHAPFDAARRVVETDRIAQERARANLLNKIAPSMIVKHTPGEMRGFARAQSASAEQREDLLAYLKKEYADAQKDGRPIVLGASTDLTPVPDTIQQIAYADVRGLTQEEILAIHKTPPPLLGILRDSTLQNFRWSIKVWWFVMLQPMLRNILWTINAQVLRRVGARDVRVWFDVDADSELGLEVLIGRAELGNALVQMGHSANDASRRAALGMPERPELDHANMGAVVAGHAADVPGAAPREIAETTPAPAQGDENVA